MGTKDGFAGSADHSMLQALCSQRDRFRAKAQDLQEALAAAEARAAAAETEAAAARADNVALVERLKYVSSYA
jgi:homeobox protein cut-like